MPKSAEKCKEIRDDMRNRILHESMLYFARNGFAGTKISDLARHIGIGQGTIYVYFDTKEDLFKEIHRMINGEKDIARVKVLAKLPINAKQKIHMMSKEIMRQLEENESFAGIIALNTQMVLEEAAGNTADTAYQLELYRYTAEIIEQGQREGSVVEGAPMKLADYYWGVVYLYSLKKLFTTRYEMISPEDLERTVLK